MQAPAEVIGRDLRPCFGTVELGSHRAYNSINSHSPQTCKAAPDKHTAQTRLQLQVTAQYRGPGLTVRQTSELPQAAPILWAQLRTFISAHLLVPSGLVPTTVALPTIPRTRRDSKQTNKRLCSSRNRQSPHHPWTRPRIADIPAREPHELRHALDIPHQAAPPATCGSSGHDGERDTSRLAAGRVPRGYALHHTCPQ